MKRTVQAGPLRLTPPPRSQILRVHGRDGGEGAGDMTGDQADRRTLLRLGATSALSGAVIVGAAACTPTVKVVAPDKPITINLNVKIDQEVRVRLDREIEDLIANNPDVFG